MWHRHINGAKIKSQIRNHTHILKAVAFLFESVTVAKQENVKCQETELEKVKKSVSFNSSHTDKVIDEIIPADSPNSIGDLESLYWFWMYEERTE